MADALSERLFTTDGIQMAWTHLNTQYFRCALPSIQILWSRRLTASAGVFSSRTGPRSFRDHADGAPSRLIRLSLPLLRNQPEQEIIRTLAHEMIHQWQFDILKRRPNHGRDFHRMMARMNRDGLGITINHRLDMAVRALTKYTWRCQDCGCSYYRQRRTIRPGLHRCGVCRGKLRQVAPSPVRSKQAGIIQLELFSIV
jgi:predicted SprT family Zn-dependent metalloprotease